MYAYHAKRDDTGRIKVSVPLRGSALLEEPIFNKGTAFTPEERHTFGLDGLLPRHVSTIEQQLKRTYENVQRNETPLGKFITLAALHDRNEHLFYRLLLEHIEEFLPIVYTPTVGDACCSYSHIFRKPRGLWITPRDRGRIAEVLRNATFDDVRLIVVTDNERILGLGDQGAGGMGIPIGKLALYTLGAGIHPTQTLPISLDVGTDNKALLDDELYLGWRHPRIRGEPYESLVDEFVTAVKTVFPRALLQWEDFKKANAFLLLDRYLDQILSFNDDIQGTASVALAGVMAGARVTGIPLSEQRVVIVGGGAAGIGIARQLRDAMRRGGRDGDDLASAIAVLDSRGMLIDPASQSEPHKAEFAWPRALASGSGLDADGANSLASVIAALKPHVLLGTTGQPNIFTEDIVRSMAAAVEQPVILPFSNPTSKAEARPADLIRWTDGRALVATGSPFDPVEHEGKTHRIGQANNVFVFPGVGLGALVAEARQVTDAMFTVAAEALAGQVEDEDLEAFALYPRLQKLRPITARIAEAVVREARDSGLGQDIADAEVEQAVAAAMWHPDYPVLEPA